MYNWRKTQSVKVLKNRNLRGLYCLSGIKVLYFNTKSKCAMRRFDAVFFENNMATVAQVKEAGFF